MPREKAPKTKTEKIIRGLIAYGYKEIPSKNKYRMFEGKDAKGEKIYYLVGKAAALRFNRKPAAVGSIAVPDSFKEKIMAWNEK